MQSRGQHQSQGWEVGRSTLTEPFHTAVGAITHSREGMYTFAQSVHDISPYATLPASSPCSPMYQVIRNLIVTVTGIID